MNNFSKLPLELWFYIVTLLPIPTLAALQGVSREWRKRFHDHESFLYRHAAVVHGFIPTFDTSLDETKASHEGDYIKGSMSWASFCEIQYRLQRNWIAKGKIYTRMMSYRKWDIHRFKIDEGRGLVITTHTKGGITVRDFKTDDILWTLPASYVRHFAHCEYGNGFLIFDRPGREKEVWRLVNEGGQSPAPPNGDQQRVYSIMKDSATPFKGHFRPWAVLSIPVASTAFRFVYPTLLVCGINEAYLHDVVTCRPPKTIHGIQVSTNINDFRRIHYVELSQKYAFVCVGNHIRLFDRESGGLAYSVSCEDVLSCVPVVKFAPITGAQIHDRSAVAQPMFPSSQHSAQPDIDDTGFLAVHVSPDGTSMVAMDEAGRLILFEDIPSLIKDPHHEHLAKRVLVIEPTGTPPYPSDFNTSVYLAYEHGRVGFVSLCGIYVFTLDVTKHQILDPIVVENARVKTDPIAGAVVAASPFPNIHCLRFVLPNDRENWYKVSCLQMNETKMFFTWNPKDYPIPKSELAGKKSDDGLDDEPGVGSQDVDLKPDPDYEYAPIRWADLPGPDGKIIACLEFDAKLK